MVIYFQTQFTGDEDTPTHSDGCCPIDHEFKDGESFRNFAHKLLDEWLDNCERNKQEIIDSILDGAHIVFSPCSAHGLHENATENESI